MFPSVALDSAAISSVTLPVATALLTRIVAAPVAETVAQIEFHALRFSELSAEDSTLPPVPPLTVKYTRLVVVFTTSLRVLLISLPKLLPPRLLGFDHAKNENCDGIICDENRQCWLLDARSIAYRPSSGA
jgi:hypothetical protein